jgi:hypothetical protein
MNEFTFHDFSALVSGWMADQEAGCLISRRTNGKQ